MTTTARQYSRRLSTTLLFLLSSCCYSGCRAFVVPQVFTHPPPSRTLPPLQPLQATTESLETIQLVISQENYGLAVVCLGEALWSFSQSPSLSNLKIVVPAVVATVLLFAVSGPMMNSGSLESTGSGLWIATGVSVLLGASYILRLAAPVSESPKEAAALGLLVALAGFASFAHNTRSIKRTQWQPTRGLGRGATLLEANRGVFNPADNGQKREQSNRTSDSRNGSLGTRC